METTSEWKGATSVSRLLGSAAAIVGVMALVACGMTPAGGGAVSRGPSRTLTSQPLDADGVLECPPTITDPQGMTVPQPPQGAVDGMARLLPNRDVASLVVCSYPVLDMMTGSLTSPYPLKKRTVLSAAQRTEVVDLLTWAPRGDGSNKPCTEMGGDETVHLVGATYRDAIVWVAAKADPNSCATSTNGDFVSTAAVGVVLDELVRAREPAPAPTGPCTARTFGRLGDDVSLAPDGDPEVTVCRNTAGGAQAATSLTPDQARRVVAALRRLSVRSTSQTCAGGDDRDYSRDFRLVLQYRAGPDVVLNVLPECQPQLLGGGLEAEDATEVVDLVEQWSAPVPGYDPDEPVSSEPSVSSAR